jgi:hypothetical protein
MAFNFIGGGNRITRRNPLTPVASRWQTLSHNVVSSTPRHEQYCSLWANQCIEKSET